MLQQRPKSTHRLHSALYIDNQDKGHLVNGKINLNQTENGPYLIHNWIFETTYFSQPRPTNTQPSYYVPRGMVDRVQLVLAMNRTVWANLKSKLGLVFIMGKMWSPD